MKNYSYLSLAALLLSLGCQKQEDPVASPTVDFTYTGASQNFTPIQFANSSTGAQTYTWNFGDGTTPSALQEPAHVFKRAGTYTVTLTATGPGGTATKSQAISIMQADTTALISQMVTGKYRFTKMRTSCYGFGCSGGSVSACDIVMTVSKVGKDIQVDNLMPVLPIAISTTNYYRFFVLKSVSAASRYEANFKKNTDSLEFTNGIGGAGGGNATTYYGKKL
jgi:PKD repeat protein